MIFLSIWDVLSCSSIWIALLVPGERLERDRRDRSQAGPCCRQRISIIWRIKQNFQTSDQLLMLTQFFLLNKRGIHLAARIPIFKKFFASSLLYIHLHKLLERNISISVLVNPLHQTPHPVLVCGEKGENYQDLTEIFPPTNTPCWWKAALYSSAVRTPSPSWQWTTPTRTTIYTCHSPCLPGRRPSSALLSGPQWPAERNVNVIVSDFIWRTTDFLFLRSRAAWNAMMVIVWVPAQTEPDLRGQWRGPVILNIRRSVRRDWRLGQILLICLLRNTRLSVNEFLTPQKERLIST